MHDKSVENKRVFNFSHYSSIFGEYNLKFIVKRLEHTYRIKIVNDITNNDLSFDVVESYVDDIDEYIENLNRDIQLTNSKLEEIID